MRLIKKGATDQIIYFDILDSASTTGGRKTGIAYNASGLIAYYTRLGAAAVQITLATQTAAGAHSDGGWVQVDATNAPGIYRLDLPDAVCATGVDATIVTVSGASGMVEASVEIQLYALDLQDGVRGGLTALPNAAADAAGGLPISDAGGLDMDSVKADTAAILVDTGTTLDGRIPAALVSGRMDASVGAVAANAITAASIATDAIDSDAVAANAVTKIQSGLALDATVAKDATVSKPGTAQTISSNADITAIKAKTDNLPASPAAVGSAMTLADDAITAGKFDETTAFPLASADTGATAVARTGADADTLETLSDQIDGVQTSVGTVDGIVDAILADTAAIDARLPSDPADESLLEAAIGARSSQTSVDTLAGYVDTEVAAIKAKTDNLPSDPADQSALEALIDALPTAAENAAAVWGATTRTLSAGAIVAATFAANALDAVWSVASRTLSAFGFTVATNSDSNVTAIKAKTDNLPASPAAVGSAMTLATDAVNAAALAADAVAEIQSGLSTLNAAGVRSAIGLASANLDTQLDALPTAVEIRTELDSNSTKLDVTVGSRLATASYTAPLSAVQTENAVWDSVMADHLDAGTTGKELSDAGGAGTPLTAQEVRDAMKLAPTVGAPAAGSVDEHLDLAALDATVAKDATVSKPATAQTINSNADITAIKAKTDNLPASPSAVGSAMTLTVAYDAAKTAASAANLAIVDGIVDDILADTAAIDLRLPSDPADESLLETAIGTRSSQTSVDTLAGYVDTEVAAIKAKTDNLPASPAAVGSAMTLSTDAVNAAALAADAVTEIQSGLSTLNAAGVRSAVGLAAANLDTQLGALPTASETRTEMDANSTKLTGIDAKTSLLAFSGGAVQADLQKIAGGATVDGITVAAWFENILSLAQGDVVRVDNTFTYKKQNGSTTTFEFTVSPTGRT